MRRVTRVSIASWILAVFVVFSSLPARHFSYTLPVSALLLHPLPFLTPSLPVFEFDLSTLQSRYVMITVLYTREPPFHVNRNHLRASTPARYPGTICLSVRNSETEDVRVVAAEFTTLAGSTLAPTVLAKRFRQI